VSISSKLKAHTFADNILEPSSPTLVDETQMLTPIPASDSIARTPKLLSRKQTPTHDADR
jgi:hypothetical protein